MERLPTTSSENVSVSSPSSMSSVNAEITGPI